MQGKFTTLNKFTFRMFALYIDNSDIKNGDSSGDFFSLKSFDFLLIHKNVWEYKYDGCRYHEQSSSLL